MANSNRYPHERDAVNVKPFIRKDLFILYNTVVEIYQQNRQQGNLDQSKEFIQLLEYCNDEYSFEARSVSSQLLLKLCHVNIISNGDLLKRFLTISATSKNLVCPISSIFELIKMGIKEQVKASGEYRCPYNISSPPHPLITVFQQRPDSCDNIIKEMKNCFEIEGQNTRTTEYILAALKPFLSYVFLDPKRASKSWEVLSLYSTLIQIIRRMQELGKLDIALDIAKFLLQMIACRKTTGLLIYENASLTEQLACCLLELPCTNEIADIVIEIGYIVISQCHKLIQTGLDITVHLNLLLKIFLMYPEGFISEEFLYLIALLLYRSPTVYKQCVLELAIHVLPCYAASCKSPSQLSILKAFTLPLMIILSSNMGQKEEKILQKLASDIFMNIENYLAAGKGKSGLDNHDFRISHQSPLELIIAKHHNALIHKINRSIESAMAFVKALKQEKNGNDSIMLVFSTILVNPQDVGLLNEALGLVSEFGKSDPSIAIEFLPLLLHSANCSKSSQIKFRILELLPTLAVNKHLVSPILKAVTMLGNCTTLLPFSIRVTTELWKIQPRIFSYLCQLLSRNVQAAEVSPDVWEELAIAKAASIFEICKLRPTQHGPDVIGLLAKIFNDFEQGLTGTKAEVAETTVYLGLEALKSLCKAEVSDFQTAWAVVSTKVMTSDSDIILKGVISLLSVTPKVLGRSTADMELRKFACDFLWQNVGHKNPNISSTSSAYLTNFSTEEFVVERLPEKIRLHAVDLLVRKHNMKKRQDDDDYDPTKESVIGPSYAYMLQLLESDATQGFSLLLSKVLKEEVEMLPRNVSSANAATRLGSAYDKFIDSIPDFLKSFYEKMSNPVLIPSIAAGLLSCFKSTIQLRRNEKTGRRHLIEDAKVNRQMLDILLSDVSIAHTDWQQSLLAPTSWCKFMGRVFDATVEGRKAELSLLFNQGRISREEELKTEVSSSIFWARDQLTEQLMKASKGNPTIQGNSILALSGLAVTMVTNDGPMDEKHSFMRYIDTKDWLVKVADTVMVVLDGNFKPKGQPFQWCQQFSSHKSTASSLLSRACAAVALSEIAAVLISVDLERIQQIAHLLTSRIPGQEKAGTSSIIQFNAGVGLGMLVYRLQHERFNDVIGQDGHIMMAKAIHALETLLYSESLENREGALFGYGLALGSLFIENAKDSRVHASASYAKLLEAVKAIPMAQTIKLIDESHFFALGTATISGFQAGSIDINSVFRAIDIFKGACKAHQKSFTLHAIYGSLLHGLMSCGLSQVKDTLEDNVDLWLKNVVDMNKEFSERIASVHGLMTAFGAISILFQFEDLDVFDPALKNKLTDVIKTMQQVVENNDDAEFCLHSCKLLSFLYMVHQGGASQQLSLPSNYNYLPESSILRSMFNCLLKATKTGPSGTFSASAVNAIISSLIAAADIKLPSVNWPQILNSLMKLGFGDETRRLCLKFAVRMRSSCAPLPTWLLSWMNPSNFLSLETHFISTKDLLSKVETCSGHPSAILTIETTSCKKEILDNIDNIINVVPLNKLKMIVEEMMIKTFQNEDGCVEERLLVLNSLKKLAAMKNPVQSSLMCVKCALIKICKDETICKNEAIIKGIAAVLSCLPNELKNDVMDTLQTTDLIVCIESAMIKFCKFPLKSMDRTFEIFSADPSSLNNMSMISLQSALHCHYKNSSSSKEHDEQVFWFLERMGRMKSFIINKMNDKWHSWLGIFSTTTNMWSSSGFNVALLDNELSNLYKAACMDLFGIQLNLLLEKPNWQHLKEKILNWLIELAEISRTKLDSSDVSLTLLKGAILRIIQSDTRLPQDTWIKSIEIVLDNELKTT